MPAVPRLLPVLPEPPAAFARVLTSGQCAARDAATRFQRNDINHVVLTLIEQLDAHNLIEFKFHYWLRQRINIALSRHFPPRRASYWCQTGRNGWFARMRQYLPDFRPHASRSSITVFMLPRDTPPKAAKLRSWHSMSVCTLMTVTTLNWSPLCGTEISPPTG